MRRKLTLIAATVALGALLVTGATLAWFTSTATATNVVTVGNVKIKINETTDDTQTAKKGTLTKDGLVTFDAITPGAVLSKVPTIENTGSNDAWVRAYVTYEYTKDGSTFTIPNGVTERPEIVFNTGDNNDQWTYDGNYYYYNSKLDTTNAKITAPLFYEVKIPSGWNNQEDTDMSGITVNVVVNAEAVQYDNNDGTNDNNIKPVIQAFATLNEK